MDEPTTAPTPEPITPEGPGGPLQNLIDLYFEPRKTFGRIVKNPAWVLPFAGYLILVLVVTGLWLNNMEPAECMKGQLQESGQWDKLTGEQREGIIDQQATFIPIISWVSAFVSTPIILLIVSGALMFVFRFFHAGEVSFKQALAIGHRLLELPGARRRHHTPDPRCHGHEGRLEHQPPGGPSGEPGTSPRQGGDGQTPVGPRHEL
jgi:hypothetical protein